MQAGAAGGNGGQGRANRVAAPAGDPGNGDGKQPRGGSPAGSPSGSKPAPASHEAARAATAKYRASNPMPEGTQVQHWTKVRSAMSSGMSAERMNRNLSPLQSRNDKPATTLLTSKDGTKGTTYTINKADGTTKTYGNEHKFADRFMIERESARLKSAAPGLDKQAAAETAGGIAKWKMTGDPGNVNSRNLKAVNIGKGEKPFPGEGGAGKRGSAPKPPGPSSKPAAPSKAAPAKAAPARPAGAAAKPAAGAPRPAGPMRQGGAGAGSPGKAAPARPSSAAGRPSAAPRPAAASAGAPKPSPNAGSAGVARGRGGSPGASAGTSAAKPAPSPGSNPGSGLGQTTLKLGGRGP